MTPSSLQDQMRTLLSDLGLTDMLRRLSDTIAAGVPVVSVAAAGAPDANPAVQMYEWGGKPNRLLPESWRIPKTGVRDAWLAYIVGQPAQGIPPLRSVSAEHVSDPGTRKRYSDFKRLMETIEDRVRKDGRWSDLCTVDNASAMFSGQRREGSRLWQERQGESVRTVGVVHCVEKHAQRQSTCSEKKWHSSRTQ